MVNRNGIERVEGLKRCSKVKIHEFVKGEN